MEKLNQRKELSMELKDLEVPEMDFNTVNKALESNNETLRKFFNEENFSNKDTYESVNYIKENDFKITPQLKETLKKYYWLTDADIIEWEAYLENIKSNPDITQSDIENMLPVLPLFWKVVLRILSLLWVGVGGYFLWRHDEAKKHMVKELMFSESWERGVPEELFEILTAKVHVTDVGSQVTLKKDIELFWVTLFKDAKTRDVKLKLDCDLSADFKDINTQFSKLSKTVDDSWNIHLLIEVPKPDLLISNVYVHDVVTNDNFAQRILPSDDMDSAYQDAYNKAIENTKKQWETNSELYEKARESMGKNIKATLLLAYQVSGYEILPNIDVEVRYTSGWWTIKYNDIESRKNK